MSLRIGALFAGYGGLDLAVEAVFGARTTWVAEFDAAPSRILAERFPDAPNLGDVTAVDWSAVEPVDIITGGSPCQDLSHAGKRAGMRPGTRSGLWASMCDAVDIIRPAFVVWENVRGALSAPAAAGDVEHCEFCLAEAGGVHLRALGRVLGDLAELGYDAAWHGIRAADVGAPHGRFRIFVLAWDAARDAAGVDGERGGRPDQPARAAADRGPGGHPLFRTPTSQLAVNGGSQHPDKRRAGGHGPTLADEVEHLLPTPAVNDMGDGKTLEWWDEWAPRQMSADGRPAPHGKSLAIETLRLMPTPTTRDHKGQNQRGDDSCLPGALLPTPKATNNENRQSLDRYGPNLGMALRADFGRYTPAIARWEAILGRLAPAPTEPTGRDGAARLSPRFVEWMMGLPDGWVTDVGLSRNDELKALGNGVVPQQAEAALGHLLGIRLWALGRDAQAVAS